MNKPYRVKTVTFQGKVGSFYLTRCVVVDEEENEFFAEVRSKELLRPNDVFFLPESCELTQDQEAKIVLSHELNPLGESVVGINATGGGTYDPVESWLNNWLDDQHWLEVKKNVDAKTKSSSSQRKTNMRSSFKNQT